MKKTQDFEDPRKKSKAAAGHFETTKAMSPPAFTSSSSLPEKAAVKTPSSSQETEESNAPEVNNNQDQKGYATISPSKLFNAVTYGHDIFKQSSVLSGVKVQGARAFGPAGCLKAPDVSAMIQADLSSEMGTSENRGMARAVSRVLGRFLDDWRRGFNIPGAMWYPAFSFFPAPMAPPMPNIPSPLAAMPSFFQFYLTHKENMIREIFRELPNEMDNDVNRNTIEAFSERTVNHFERWINTTYLTGLMGMGNVPGFAPPFQLGGPVHGQVLPKAGVLS